MASLRPSKMAARRPNWSALTLAPPGASLRFSQQYRQSMSPVSPRVLTMTDTAVPVSSASRLR